MDYLTLAIGFHWAPLGGSWYVNSKTDCSRFRKPPAGRRDRGFNIKNILLYVYTTDCSLALWFWVFREAREGHSSQACGPPHAWRPPIIAHQIHPPPCLGSRPSRRAEAPESGCPRSHLKLKPKRLGLLERLLCDQERPYVPAGGEGNF